MNDRPYRFDVCKTALEGLLGDLAILAGDVVGPSDSSTRSVLDTAIVNAEVLLSQLQKARAGGPVIVFPSPAEALECDNIEVLVHDDNDIDTDMFPMALVDLEEDEA